MLFEKEKYYKYVNELENMVNFSYAMFIIIFGIIGLAIASVIGLLLGIIIGILISKMYTLNAKIKIQKMRWEIDIYEMQKEKNK